tara:strand:+ start:52 stop:297 length:246 start_codon:yes stop_codon:yes gene_type:complete
MKKSYEVEIGMSFHVYASEVVEADNEESALRKMTRMMEDDSNLMEFMLHHLADKYSDEYDYLAVNYVERLPVYTIKEVTNE